MRTNWLASSTACVLTAPNGSWQTRGFKTVKTFSVAVVGRNLLEGRAISAGSHPFFPLILAPRVGPIGVIRRQLAKTRDS